MNRSTLHLTVPALLLALPMGIRAAEVVKARKPDPRSLPTLSVYNDDKFSRGKVLTIVAATFPNVPNFTCDSWCYESAVDCMHNNPQWLPAASVPEKRVWRLKVYVMENDPDALTARVVKAFPKARPHP